MQSTNSIETIRIDQNLIANSSTVTRTIRDCRILFGSRADNLWRDRKF